MHEYGKQICSENLKIMILGIYGYLLLLKNGIRGVLKGRAQPLPPWIKEICGFMWGFWAPTLKRIKNQPPDLKIIRYKYSELTKKNFRGWDFYTYPYKIFSETFWWHLVSLEKCLDKYLYSIHPNPFMFLNTNSAV